MATLETLNFDNLALRSLPIDKETKNYVRTVAGACFSRVSPTPLQNPRLVCCSKAALELLDIGEDQINRPEFVEYFSGNKILPGSETAAHCYCGHQFGYFSGQLGDGAAIYLGEIVNKKGERWEIQLKGAGLTPYSRQADGRKVLRSSIREFLCSEAMHYLGVPTTRAGTIITSDSKVTRDMFYDGHPKEENCAVVLRIAPTFLRFGSFEIFKTMDPFTGRVGPSVGRRDILVKMLDYTISTFFPEIYSSYDDNRLRYSEFFKQVVLKTAQLVAKWQSVGFCHGVLNTDNMSILGLTIDYGPFGFLDSFNPDHICNSSDDGGRYTYIRQPEICFWNLRKFAEVLDPEFPLADSIPLLDLFGPEFESVYFDLMMKKLGLFTEQDDDRTLIQNFFNTMETSGADFTNSFRLLSSLALPGMPEHDLSKATLLDNLCDQCLPLPQLQQSLTAYMDEKQYHLLVNLMNSNPGLLEQLGKGTLALQRELKKIDRAKKLKDMTPEQKVIQNREVWQSWIDSYCQRLEVETKASTNLTDLYNRRVTTMNAHNPKYILRNYIAQVAIQKAEVGDFSEVQRVLELLQHPYEENIEFTKPHRPSQASDDIGGSSSDSSLINYCKPPEWAARLKVSCSS